MLGAQCMQLQYHLDFQRCYIVCTRADVEGSQQLPHGLTEVSVFLIITCHRRHFFNTVCRVKLSKTA